MTNPFAGSSNADAGERNEYLPWYDAEYDVTIRRCQMKTNRDGSMAFIVDFVVDDSSVPEVVPSGTVRGWYCGKNDSFLGNTKSFCHGVYKISPADALDTDAILLGCVGPANSFAGQKLRIKTKAILTKGGDKGPFTVHEFPVPGFGLGFAPAMSGEAKHRSRIGLAQTAQAAAAAQLPPPNIGAPPAYAAPPPPPGAPAFAAPPPPPGAPAFAAPPPPPGAPAASGPVPIDVGGGNIKMWDPVAQKFLP